MHTIGTDQHVAVHVLAVFQQQGHAVGSCSKSVTRAPTCTEPGARSLSAWTST